MRDAQIVTALNHWMDRYISDPTGFQREFETVRDFQGREHPEYGAQCLAYMKQIISEVEPKKGRPNGRGKNRRRAD